MVKVHRMAAADRPATSDDFKRVQSDLKLAPIQVAEAMGVSPATVEAWKRGMNSPPSVRVLEERAAGFARAFPGKDQGKNLVFRRLPLRTAREVLGYTIEEMAAEYDYSISSWTKFEANFRTLPSETRSKIEADMRNRLAEICSA